MSNEQSNSAKIFAEFWKDKGREKSQSQSFWLSLLRDIFGIEKPEQFIEFEDVVHLDKENGFIDAYIPTTHVLIEQKSIEKDLRKPIKQSDGSLLTPFQQAKRYSVDLPYSQRPRWIVTCNFKSFLIYDMENPNAEPEEILLENLYKEYYRLEFMINSENENLKREMEISIQAGELVGKLYDEIIKLYINPESEESLKSLNKLCVRIVFCLYAEDSGIFGKRGMFHNYLAQFSARDLRRALIDLFKVLDTEPDERDPYLDEELASFPYVNGGLFEDENIEIPQLNETVKEILLSKASEGFDWSEISPTIFGAVFESTLNPDTRRSGGMHYTSIENIHKVINPLFLDNLNEELSEIIEIKELRKRNKKLLEFQDKLASLKFLDPACGSGNFLTETYLSLRKIENKIIDIINRGQIGLVVESYSPIKVSIQQFYGIEINDFAVTVAKTALWIAESQMMKETENILHISLDFLPLKSYTNITEENALRIDWNIIIPKEDLNYIMGNPPFVGARLMKDEQKEDLNIIFSEIRNAGNLDYVSCWYKKAVDYIKNTQIEVALVSTNSICQGEQTAILWKPLIESGIHINFAHRTFRWDSEATLQAQVYCIIVGFSFKNRTNKYLFDNGTIKKVNNINPYLVDAENVFIENRRTPISNVCKMEAGSMPNDDGYLSDYSAEDKNNICNRYPNAEPLFRKFLGADEFINSVERYCIWLKDVEPSTYKSIPPIIEAINNVKVKRASSRREATRILSETPYLFGEIRQPLTNYLLIPRHSSENRKYIPIGYMTPDIICGDANLIIPNATLYEFGVLTSNVHMAWMRAVSGRLKSDYRYSAQIVYNNFPWCSPTPQQIEKIENTAQEILKARALYPESSLADLYDNLTMPQELLDAHRKNDRAVMEAYGFPVKNNFTESMCVARLMELYEEISNNTHSI